MKSLMQRVRELTAQTLGCGDCTMIAEWRTSAVQNPPKCQLNELFIHCPITGEMPYDWDKCDKDLRYVFIDEEGDE